MLKELLSDPEVKSTLKELLSEEEKPKKKRGRPKGSTNKKTTVKRATKKKTPTAVEVEENPDYYVTEDGKVIDLSKIKVENRKKQYRNKPTPRKKKKCERCSTEFEVWGTGYLCDKCLRG